MRKIEMWDLLLTGAVIGASLTVVLRTPMSGMGGVAALALVLAALNAGRRLVFR